MWTDGISEDFSGGDHRGDPQRQDSDVQIRGQGRYYILRADCRLYGDRVGLHVKNLRYYKSQPWSFSETLLMGFFAELDGEDTITLDTEELATAGWFTREEAPAQPLNISLTSEMIWKFKNGEA